MSEEGDMYFMTMTLKHSDTLFHNELLSWHNTVSAFLLLV
jgi:hypothetical protein